MLSDFTNIFNFKHPTVIDNMLLYLFYFALALFISIVRSVTPPSSPKGGSSPKLERFYSTQSSFGDQASSSHSSESPTKKQSRPVNIARKMTAAHSAGAIHSIVKAAVMSPAQLCAGAAGCIRQRIQYETLKRDPKATKEQISESKETLRDQRKHMLRAPVGELIAGVKNTQEFIHLASQDQKAVSALKKQELRQNMVSGPTRMTNGMDKFTDEAWKKTKNGIKQHSAQQWKYTGHALHLGATGKDSELSLRK